MVSKQLGKEGMAIRLTKKNLHSGAGTPEMVRNNEDPYLYMK